MGKSSLNTDLSWLPIVLQCHAELENSERNEIVLQLMRHAKFQAESVAGGALKDSFNPIATHRSEAGSSAYVLQYPGRLAALSVIRPAHGDYQSVTALNDSVDLLKGILQESLQSIDLFQAILHADRITKLQADWSRQCYALAGLAELATLGQFELSMVGKGQSSRQTLPTQHNHTPDNLQAGICQNEESTVPGESGNGEDDNSRLKPIQLELVPWTDELTPRLCSVVEKTYEGSLDVPQLNGMRTVADTLTGYLTASPSSEPLWWLVQCKGESDELADCGCLLLSRHDERTAELVYFGVCPEFRGFGIGQKLIAKMLWHAQAIGIERILLAVDQDNKFASRIYTQSGFRQIGTAEVWYRPSKA